MRRRPAPSAARIAISFCRVAARAKSRLATFAHAMARTKPTAPSKMSNGRRTSPTKASCKGVSVALFPFMPYCTPMRWAIAISSARAVSTVTPGFKRAIA